MLTFNQGSYTGLASNRTTTYRFENILEVNLYWFYLVLFHCDKDIAQRIHVLVYSLVY